MYFMMFFFFAFLGLLEGCSQLPQIHFLLSVLSWIRMVCPVFEETLLHETVLSVCVDTRRVAHRRPAVVSHH